MSCFPFELSFKEFESDSEDTSFTGESPDCLPSLAGIAIALHP